MKIITKGQGIFLGHQILLNVCGVLVHRRFAEDALRQLSVNHFLDAKFSPVAHGHDFLIKMPGTLCADSLLFSTGKSSETKIKADRV
jgi:hypothetical protein